MPGSNGLIGVIERSPSPLDYVLLPRAGYLFGPLASARGPNSNHWSGPGYLSGTVKIGTTLVQRRVRLYEHATGKLLEEKTAEADGSYRFDWLRTDILYTVSATDYANNYDDVIACRVSALLA